MSAKGFTLLEVMVALAIFATAAVAITKVAMQYTQATANNKLRTEAQFVAMNEIARMEIEQQWLTGTETKQVTEQGGTWKILKKASATISPKIQRIELQIQYVDPDTQVESPVSHMAFFNHQASE